MEDAFSKHPQVGKSTFITRIHDAIPTLPEQEARVAQYMVLNVDHLGFETGASIAKKASTSEVTVGRLLRRMGYKGMAALKQEIKSEQTQNYLNTGHELLPDEVGSQMKHALDSEIKSLMSVFKQASSPRWASIIKTIFDADIVYVSGFQTIKGAAEDFTKRLSLAKDNVRFLSAHDGMLGEWIGSTNNDKKEKKKECQVIIDIVPYAREAEALSKLCKDQGRDLIVVSDEFCHWASDYTDMIIHAPSKNGMSFESTGSLVTALNLMVHAIAEKDPAAMQKRLENWQAMTRKIKIF